MNDDRPDAGTDALLTAALGRVIDEVAARTDMPVVMPVKEILHAVYRELEDVPRIPDYDPAAPPHLWAEPREYAPDEVPGRTRGLTVRAEEGGVVVLDQDGQRWLLGAAEAKELFLAGLAAARYARGASTSV